MKYDIPLKLKRLVTVTDPPPERAEFVPEGEPCWLVTDPKKLNNDGYGQLKYNGKLWGTHRLVFYILSRKHPELPRPSMPGEEADGVVYDHLCERRNCCNPAHLDPISQSENVQRGARWRSTQPAPEQP